MSNKKGSEIPWWAIVLGFIVYPPIGVVLFVLNLCGVRIPVERIRKELELDDRSGQRRQTPPAASGYTWQGKAAGTGSAPQAGKGTGQAAPGGGRAYAYGQGKAQPKRGLGRFLKEPKSGTGMTVAGAIMAFVFALGFVEPFTMGLKYGLLTYADEWFPVLGFLCAGLFLLGKGISKTRLSRRMKLYQGIIGQRSSVFLSDLAATAGVSEKKVVADLQRMIADGYLPMGYIDRASGRLVLTDRGYEAPEPEGKKEAEKSREKTAEDDDEILRQIRAVNDAIPGEEMSRKIDRIGEITKKILDYQRQNPAKAGELRQFLNYYLPTTLKLLKTYAQLEAQGVEGENITAAKVRIEGMMDKVVEGFEKQLDQLFQTDAMDIASDVEVLERMLEKDGLGSGMNLGG